MDHNGTIVTAWIYMLPKWTPNLLQSSSNYLETYNSNGPHNRPYIKRFRVYETLAKTFFWRFEFIDEKILTDENQQNFHTLDEYEWNYSKTNQRYLSCDIFEESLYVNILRN